MNSIMGEYETPGTSRRVAQAMLLGGEWARSMLAPPGTPPERVKILREGYAKAMKDPDLVTEAKKGRVEIRPSTGEELQLLAADVMKQPPEVVEKIKKLFQVK